MKDLAFNNTNLLTPSYVYEQAYIIEILEILNGLKERTGCQILYSMKSACVIGLLNIIKPYVSGFSCSSLFELKLATEILDRTQSLHIVTPGYRHDEWDKIIELSDYVTLNSVSQWQRMAKQGNKKVSYGIRINPELSYVKDERYDPCRVNSKLGITFDQIKEVIKTSTLNWSVIKGIHIHNNCRSITLHQLKQSVETVILNLSPYKMNLNWINLGGGYLFNKNMDLKSLEEMINWLKSEFSVDVFIEPGNAVVGMAGYLVSSVIDLVEHKNNRIVVLDTSVNHLPEVFEYQYQPLVMNTLEKGQYQYQLAGCSCLSGDLFGNYYFAHELSLGNRIVFENVGAYMQVKANMFNGINLPATYLLNSDNELKLLTKNNYNLFLDRL